MNHEQAQANLQLVLDWIDAMRRGVIDAIAERFHQPRPPGGRARRGWARRLPVAVGISGRVRGSRR